MQLPSRDVSDSEVWWLLQVTDMIGVSTRRQGNKSRAVAQFWRSTDPIGQGQGRKFLPVWRDATDLSHWIVDGDDEPDFHPWKIEVRPTGLLWFPFELEDDGFIPASVWELVNSSGIPLGQVGGPPPLVDEIWNDLES